MTKATGYNEYEFERVAVAESKGAVAVAVGENKDSAAGEQSAAAAAVGVWKISMVRTVIAKDKPWYVACWQGLKRSLCCCC